MSGSVPVAVFAYARPRQLGRTLGALARCEGFRGSRTHVFCDAPRSDRDAPRVAATRRLATIWGGWHGARVVTRTENRGFRNITDGIGELCATHGAAISFEDDHVPAPAALRFLDRALARYRQDDAVFQVCAARAGGRLAGAPDTFFSPVPMPVGWGTWQRAWCRFSWECHGAPAALRDADRRRAFDLQGAYPAARLLARALEGAFDSYFIRWYWAMFEAGGLALSPRVSMVLNTGLDSGVHGHGGTSGRHAFHNGAFDPAVRVDAWSFPAATAIDQFAFAALRAAIIRRYARP